MVAARPLYAPSSAHCRPIRPISSRAAKRSRPRTSRWCGSRRAPARRRSRTALATAMIARAIAASVPFKWVAGDTVYGVGDVEQQLRQADKGYVLGVSSAHVFQSWGKRRSVAGNAADIARTRRSSDWKRLSAGAGTKGPRLHDWCYLELADLEVEDANSADQALWT